MNNALEARRDLATADADSPRLRSRSRLVRETWFTWANLVTAVRTVAGLGCFAVAAAKGDATWNFAGLAVYWVLDIADGAVARRLRQETRIGAQLDILCDRVLLASFYANLLREHPGMAIPIGLHMLQFLVVDHYLSNQFMRWPVLSPNYFYEVDRTVWALNWSALGKTVNGGLVTLAVVVCAVADSSWTIAAAASIAVTAEKVYSIVRLQRLPAPEAWIRSASAD